MVENRKSSRIKSSIDDSGRELMPLTKTLQCNWSVFVSHQVYPPPFAPHREPDTPPRGLFGRPSPGPCDDRGDNPLFQAFVSTGLMVPQQLLNLKLQVFLI